MEFQNTGLFFFANNTVQEKTKKALCEMSWLSQNKTSLAIAGAVVAAFYALLPSKKKKTRIVCSDLAPLAIGPYNQAISHDGMVYVSGNIGLTPEGQFVDSKDVAKQARQALTNMQNILEEAGSSMDDVVKCQVLLVSMDDYAAVNEVYAEFFIARYPARVAFAVTTLPKNALVEIDCTAVLPE